MKEQIKSRTGSILLVLVAIVGLSLLLYPSLSNYWNSIYSTHAISVYSERVATISEKEYTDIWESAWNYNNGIRYGSQEHILKDRDRHTYENLLNISGDGVMGYMEIPSIKVTLPISHGTSDEVLERGVGHVDWSSLPVGGKSTHCVLSSHRGLPSAKLFTDLDKLELGDTFMLFILDEVLTYKVDQILIVKPEETEALSITEGEDYCTLATCTPYGINTHRLLVRGHRIDNEDDAATVHVTSEGVVIEPLLIAPLVAIPMLIIVFIIILALDRKNKNLTMEDEENETK